MGFSDKMRESLGVEGARVEVQGADETVSPGGVAHARVNIHGGTRAAKVEGLILRLIEARRSWQDSAGQAIAEDAAQALEDRSHLMPVWTRQTVSESRLEIEQSVDASDTHEVVVELAVPDSCGATSPACVVTLHAQADIKGQIDPTGTTQVPVA
jgi:sporulation-control protein spo0M